MAAPRGFPATFAHLGIWFLPGLFLSASGIGFATLPLLVASPWVEFLPAETVWLAAFSVTATSAAWIAVEVLTSETRDAGEIDVESVLDVDIRFALALLGLSVLYANLLVAGGVAAAMVATDAGFATWAPLLATVLPSLDMAISRRHGFSLAGGVVYLLAVALERSGTFHADGRRLPFGQRLPR